jgi:hypothetical protein
MTWVKSPGPRRERRVRPRAPSWASAPIRGRPMAPAHTRFKDSDVSRRHWAASGGHHQWSATTPSHPPARPPATPLRIRVRFDSDHRVGCKARSPSRSPARDSDTLSVAVPDSQVRSYCSHAPSHTRHTVVQWRSWTLTLRQPLACSLSSLQEPAPSPPGLFESRNPTIREAPRISRIALCLHTMTVQPRQGPSTGTRRVRVVRVTVTTVT